MVVENDGRHVREDQSLVGHVAADFDPKGALELHGIDLRYALHSPQTGRWERCLFSCALAATLELLAADDELPFAFETTPSQGVLIRKAPLKRSRLIEKAPINPLG